MQRSTPATIHTEGWVVDWVERALHMDGEGGHLSSLNRPHVAIDLNFLFSAAEALFVCLLGQTMKITGGQLRLPWVVPNLNTDSNSPRFYVVEYPTMVEIKLMVVGHHRLSTQTASSGGGTEVARRREALQYLAVIKVPLQWHLLNRLDDQQSLIINQI